MLPNTGLRPVTLPNGVQGYVNANGDFVDASGNSMSAAPTSGTNSAANTGMNPYAYPTAQTAPVASFMGDYGLVRFTSAYPGSNLNSYTTWYIDPANKTIRPFAPGAFESLYTDPASQQAVVTLDSSAISPGGVLNGYSVMDNKYAIQPNGTALGISYSPSQLSARYGQPVNAQIEQSSYMLVDSFIDSLSNSQSGIPASYVNQVKNDPNQLAFYINALAYGGYSVGDIYADIKRNSLVAQGNTAAAGLKPISANTYKNDYVNTAAGQAVASSALLAAPAQIGNFDPTVMNLPVYQIPDEAFRTLIPVLDFNSDEFKARMNEVETSYYDILLQQWNAKTEQEKQLADYNYETLRKQVEENYGIRLSNNALDAWSQIENAYDQFSTRGLYNTGIQGESIDDYLRSVRRADQATRTAKLSDEEANKASYYTNYATPEQIKQLIAEDEASGKPREEWNSVRWGLLPSQDVLDSFSLDALKAKYPNAREEDLIRYRTAVLDENNNYRSSLFQKRMENELKTLVDKTTYQQTQAINKSLREEEKAYQQFTTPDVAFLRDNNNTGSVAVPGTTDQYQAVPGLYSQPAQNGQYSTAQMADILSSSRAQLESMLQSLNPAYGATQPSAQTTQQPAYTPTYTQPTRTPTYASPAQTAPAASSVKPTAPVAGRLMTYNTPLMSYNPVSTPNASATSAAKAVASTLASGKTPEYSSLKPSVTYSSLQTATKAPAASTLPKSTTTNSSSILGSISSGASSLLSKFKSWF